MLWELVHVFFEHRGLLEGRNERRVHDAGASSFLYPFLDERESDLDAVLEDVRRSVLMKADEVGALREQTLTDNASVLVDAAAGAARRASSAAASCSRSATADRPPTRWTSSPTSERRSARDRPDRGSGDPDRDRQRHRRRGDLLTAGDRVRRDRGRRARPVDVGQLGQRDRGTGRGAAPRARDDRDGRLRRRPRRRRGARRSRRGHALRAHPADPGGPGERVPRARELVG